MKTIVIIDDEKDILEILQSSLELIFDKIFEIHTFTNPSDAVAFVQKKSADIIISDLNMGAISGIDVFQKLKFNMNVNNFIFLSGYLNDYENIIHKFSNCYILNKPVKIDELSKIIQNVLNLNLL